ncbi:DUF6507 family protein [Streptomyces thermodiastaticus]|uniref:DUF6507 family protein n=1 Tax=Streptomyces thermodiastaticus TaxID=44061 RepID=UPI00227D86DB|nr:DUF6507 family protein [Streptomyces thermodiastaticus]
MTGWDITPSGVESILSLVGLAAEDLSKDIKGYGKSVEEAAQCAGTTSGPYCGPAPAGPVGAAVANFVSDTQGQITFMAARIRKTMDGTVKATNAYVEGDLEMAARSQREAAKVPTAAELRASKSAFQMDYPMSHRVAILDVHESLENLTPRIFEGVAHLAQRSASYLPTPIRGWRYHGPI